MNIQLITDSDWENYIQQKYEQRFFSGINFDLTSMKQATSNKPGSTHRNTCYKSLVLSFLHSLFVHFLFIFIRFHTIQIHFWCFVKNVFLKILQNSQENTCARVQVCNFIKKETLSQVFSCEFCEILKNTFFIEHFRWLLLFLHIGKNYR